MLYYHGSHDHLQPGTILTPQPGYEKRWGDTDFYHVLERYRPKDLLGHAQAVFLCDNPDDIDSAGGAIDWLFTVRPMGSVQKHAMGWSTAISVAVADGASEERLAELAANYWNGFPHPDGVNEYLTTSAEILSVEAY